MSTLVVGAVVGTVAGLGGWFALRGVLSHPTLERTNVRGLAVPTAGGLAAVVGILPFWAFIALHGSQGWELVSFEVSTAVAPAAVVLVAFGVIGLVDDLLGSGDDRGFSGHLRSIRQGRPSTGAVKLVGGGCLAVVLATAYPMAPRSVWMVLADAALIALAANLANLFDRAPGRVSKVSLLVLLALVLAASASERATLGVAVVVVFAMVGLLRVELDERVMLGDTGANPLGAALGLGVVVTSGPVTRVVVLVALLALNLASEWVSFSRVIAATPGLRHLDELGRRTA